MTITHGCRNHSPWNLPVFFQKLRSFILQKNIFQDEILDCSIACQQIWVLLFEQKDLRI